MSRRKRRGVLQANTDTTESLNDMLMTVDLDAYTQHMDKFVHFSYYNLANLTVYNVHFGIEFSDAIMSLIQWTSTPTCVKLNFFKGNFMLLNPQNQNLRTYYFDARPVFRINDFFACLDANLNMDKRVCTGNGLRAFEANEQQNASCLCLRGFMGRECEITNVCFTQLQNVTINGRVFNRYVKLTTICENSGYCVPNMNNLKYSPTCLCSLQFTGNEQNFFLNT